MKKLLLKLRMIPHGVDADVMQLGEFLSNNFDEISAAIARNITLERQNTELQAANTERVLKNRELRAELKADIEERASKEAYDRAESIELFNLIGEILQEAQEHPQRLVAFNSPLLGMLTIKYFGYIHGELSLEELDSYDKFRSVIDSRGNEVASFKAENAELRAHLDQAAEKLINQKYIVVGSDIGKEGGDNTVFVQRKGDNLSDMVESEPVVGFCTPSDIKKTLLSLDISDFIAPAFQSGKKIKIEKKAPYGYCPVCVAPGVERQRRPNGNDTCENGHTYKSSQAVITKQPK